MNAIIPYFKSQKGKKNRPCIHYGSRFVKTVDDKSDYIPIQKRINILLAIHVI